MPKPETTIEQQAVMALREFPLPSQSATSGENYQRILAWLYGGGRTPAGIVIDLSCGERTDVD